MDEDQKLYNVYACRFDGSDPVLEGECLYIMDAEKLAAEIMERGPEWDAYIVATDEDAGPFMRKEI